MSASGKPGTPLRIAKTALALAIAAAALLFLARALHASWGALQPVLLTSRVLVTLLGLSVVYGFTFFIPCAAWYYALRQNAPARVPFGAAANVYCVANIGKYLPGSVMHFAGRQLLGKRLGWSHLAIARATILEIGATAAGIGLVVLAIGLTSEGAPLIASVLDRIGIAPAHWRPAAALLLGAALLSLLPLARLQVFERLFGLPLKAALVVLLLDALYFAIYGAMAAFFVQQLALIPAAPEPAQVAIAFLVAWLVGYAVPGAPGGIGVRESMLVLILAGAGDGGTAALALGLGMRFVNTLGDAICFGLAYLLSRGAAACAKA